MSSDYDQELETIVIKKRKFLKKLKATRDLE